MSIRKVVLLSCALALVLVSSAAAAAVYLSRTHYNVHWTVYHSGSQVYCGGGAPYFGSVAVPRPGLYGYQPCGTLIKLDSPFGGRRYFRVMDCIGYGSQLDFYAPGLSSGQRHYRVVRRRR